MVRAGRVPVRVIGGNPQPIAVVSRRWIPKLKPTPPDPPGPGSPWVRGLSADRLMLLSGETVPSSLIRDNSVYYYEPGSPNHPIRLYVDAANDRFIFFVGWGSSGWTAARWGNGFAFYRLETEYAIFDTFNPAYVGSNPEDYQIPYNDSAWSDAGIVVDDDTNEEIWYGISIL